PVSGVAVTGYMGELAGTTVSICSDTGTRILFGFGCIPAFAGLLKPLGGSRCWNLGRPSAPASAWVCCPSSIHNYNFVVKSLQDFTDWRRKIPRKNCRDGRDRILGNMEEQGKFFETKELEKMWPAMDFDQWRASGVKASRTQGKGDRYISDLNWFIGDWLLAGKEQVSKKRGGKKWGSMKEVRELAVLLWPKPWATLKNYMGIAKEFPKKSRRRDNLYWSHHAEVRK